jgi:transposase
MRKIKEVLRLKFELELGDRQIARSCSINHNTVGDYVRRARATGLDRWPLPADLDDAAIEARLFPPRATLAPVRPAPDWPAVHEELRGNKHVTLQLLWQEYKQANPDGYSYTRFCELYQQWSVRLDVVLRQEHRAGEKLFVDYAGATVPIIDSKTGEIHEASIFVAVLGASSYTYAEASWNQNLPSWIGSHIRALEFFQGAPALAVPDNLKNAVRRPCR